jgi:EAL domain-containing protein (putative c-di-GMP-specific phosphodiesterase class I)
MEDDGGGMTALAMAQRIVGSFEAAYTIAEREMTVRTSVGIATADSSIMEMGQLLRNADLAMYRAKSAGGGSYVDYDPEMHRSLVERLELERELRRAVRDGTIEVHYQAILAIRSEQVVGFEALARWPHPERGYVPPTTFIPLAEQTDVIHALGRMVLETACRQLVAWQGFDDVPADLSMSVNISGHQLQRHDFVEIVAEVIAETGINPSCLVLELTESVLLGDTEGALNTLQRLKALGIRLAIDDFGTGYSSLSYLHRFPIDILKIDKSFVDRLGGSTADEEVMSTILQLGANLHMTTVAEGIEGFQQALALRRLGCELAQGFHYASPVPAAQIDRLLVGIDLPEMTDAP